MQSCAPGVTISKRMLPEVYRSHAEFLPYGIRGQLRADFTSCSAMHAFARWSSMTLPAAFACAMRSGEKFLTMSHLSWHLLCRCAWMVARFLSLVLTWFAHVGEKDRRLPRSSVVGLGEDCTRESAGGCS